MDVDKKTQFHNPWVLNAVDPELLMIGTSSLYEEDPDFIPGDPGDDITLQNGAMTSTGFDSWTPANSAVFGKIHAIAYGGRELDGTGTLIDKPRIAYASYAGTTLVGGVETAKGKLLMRRDVGQDFMEITSWQGIPQGLYIYDIALHPHDWRTLYVVDNQERIWMGNRKAGPNDFDYEWTNLTGDLGKVAGDDDAFKNDGIHTIEVVVNPGPTNSPDDDTEILLVGGKGGVYRSLDPKPDGHWSKFGAGLPNVIVTDVHYVPSDDPKDDPMNPAYDPTKPANDLLLVGTLGRGAFTISNALQELKKTSDITITGTAADDHLRVALNPNKPWMMDLFVGGNNDLPAKSFNLTGIDTLKIEGLGGNDTITLDATRGLVFLPGGIIVDGGPDSDTLVFQNPDGVGVVGTPAANPTSAKWKGGDGFGQSRLSKVTFPNVEGQPQLGVVPPAPAAAASVGLQGLGGIFGTLFQNSLAGVDLPFVNSKSLRSGLGGTVLELPNPLGLPKTLPTSQVRPGGITQINDSQNIFDRILSVGVTALNFQTLANSLNSPADLAQQLADLDFSSMASITATLTANVTLGLDLKAASDGENPAEWLFLKDTSFTAAISATASDIDALARFGFLGVQIVDGTATINSQVTVSLIDPGVGPEADGKITVGEIISAIGDPTTLIDVELTGSANLALPISAPFLGLAPSPDTTLGIDWSDLSDPETLNVLLPSGLTELGNFNNMDAGTFVSLVGQVTSWLGDFGDSDAFALDIPLVGDALRGVLEVSDLLRDTLLIDDQDNQEAADDVPKLLDAANSPTFVTGTTHPWATVQELAQKLTEILGNSNITYDATTDSLLIDLSLSQTFGSADVPLDFNLDFAPLGDLTSQGKLHLSADGTINLGARRLPW